MKTQTVLNVARKAIVLLVAASFVPNAFSQRRAPAVFSNSARGRLHRGAVYAPAPYYYQPYYSAPYFYPQIPTVITIPGLVPGARYEDYRDTRLEGNWATSSYPDPRSTPASASTFSYITRYEPEPRLIIRLPEPNRVVHPPPVGASRADVLKQFGEPWGRITVRGIETLYFDDLNVVIGADGRVASAR